MKMSIAGLKMSGVSLLPSVDGSKYELTTNHLFSNLCIRSYHLGSSKSSISHYLSIFKT